MTEVLADRLKAALADRYLIERELGEGGMASVYLAQDLRHDRKVALKVLKPELAAVIGASRFLQEIRVTANLQHPHILPLFDSGEADSFLFYVMPFIEGESLRDRLTREKQLPVDEAIEITRAVASALDYAHRHKVIHRDIKPENILLHDGQPVVADFGIALAVSVAGKTRITETGLSLGTPHYMSPEQATADRELDARSDIYSLGCVIYEMLGGEPPHTGPTVQSIIAKVLTDEPRRVRSMRSSVPPHVEDAIHKALAKLPADRFNSAQQFAEALTRPATGAVPAEPGLVIRIPRPVAAAAAWVGNNQLATVLGLGLLISIGVALWALLRPVPQPPVARFTLRLPQGAPLGDAAGTTIAVSPDGSRIVYVASTSGGLQLYMRGLDQLDPVPIPGTAGATQPFVSPNGEWLAFQQAGKLTKVALAGGPVLPITDIPRGILGASWGPGDSIVFATGSALLAVPAAGGQPRLLVAADSARGETLIWPEVLPNGRAILVTTRRGSTDHLAVFVPRTGELKRFDQAGSNPHYVTTGHVLLAYLTGTLVTVPFDPERLEIRGSAFPVAEGVEVGSGGAAKLGISRDGDLVHSTGVSGRRRLVLVDRRGSARDLAMEPLTISDPRLSPDGRRIALTVSQNNRSDIWVFDIAQRTRTRVTFDTTAGRPIWTPDGRRIVYFRENQGADLYWVPADGSASAESLLVAPDLQFAGDFTPDGRTLVYRAGGTPRSLWSIRVDSAGAPRQFLANPFNNQTPSFSPDGRWVVYVSDESGRNEVYVRPFPGPGGRWQVSLDGGAEPRWSSTGGEIFYRSGAGMMAAVVRTAPEFAVGDRAALFEGAYLSGGVYTQYDVSRDGQSFVMVRPETESQEAIVVLNWFQNLRAGTRGAGRAVER